MLTSQAILKSTPFRHKRTSPRGAGTGPSDAKQSAKVTREIFEFLDEFREGHFVATVVDRRRGRYTSSSGRWPS